MLNLELITTGDQNALTGRCRLQEQLNRLLEALEGAEKALIIPHNDPDPDAVASAAALQYLLLHKLNLPAEIVYDGIIGRAENKALVNFLNTPLRRFNPEDLEDNSRTAYLLVDSQPGSGNNPLTVDQPVAVVIDHHPPLENNNLAIVSIITPELGATSTILTEFLRLANLQPTRELATALFYGIKSDTRGLSRGTSPADIAAYFYLQPLIDVDALVEIEQAQVPSEYFQSLAMTLQNARVYGDAIFAYIGKTEYPDMAAEMADLLLRIEQIRWAICMNTFENQMIISVRTQNPNGGADDLVKHIANGIGSAGGHGMLAGGQIHLDHQDPGELAHLLLKRTLSYFNLPQDLEGQPLVDRKPLDLP